MQRWTGSGCSSRADCSSSWTEGIVLIGTILFWDYAIDWLDHRFPGLHLNIGAPQLLVQNGRMIKRNMDRENISEEDLMSHHRQHGIENLGAVRKAYAEGDGSISVIRAENAGAGRRGRGG